MRGCGRWYRRPPLVVALLPVEFLSGITIAIRLHDIRGLDGSALELHDKMMSKKTRILIENGGRRPS